MSYLDRLKTARYISPSGVTILFSYDDLNRTNATKSSIQELPFQDGGKIQRQGNAIIRYPIVASIYGDNYDILADRFFTALREKGDFGILDHPRWGEIKVIPITFTQAEKFVDGTRVATITIDFAEFKDQESPISQKEQKSKFLRLLDSFAEFATLDFLNNFRIDRLIEKNTAVQTFDNLLTSLETGLVNITQTTEEVKNQYDTILRNIDRANGLVDDTQTTIANIINLSFLGGAVPQNIDNISNSYQSIVNNFQKTSVMNTNREYVNVALELQVFSASSVASLALSIINFEFVNKVEAITVLDNLQSLFNQVVIFQDELQVVFEDNLSDDTYIFTNDTYSYLTELISITYDYVINQLFDLKVEQIVITDKETNPLVLSYELYGTIDKLDTLIADNNLIKYELLTIPIGKEIKIYV